jgi:cyclomaltodextrinase / maltogenic alpha-amylase / neopullulanase
MMPLRAARLVLTLALLPIAAAAAAPASPAPATMAARPAPDWLRRAVVYELYPRAFTREGTFAAIVPRLAELRDLGVDVLWLMPIHPIGETLRKGSLGSPYAVRDYYGVNPEFGSPDDLRRLVAAARAAGMRVILDVVLNHSSWDNALLREHPEFYKRDAAGKIIPPDPDWTDVAGFDYSNRSLRAYMIAMLRHWVRDYGIDGFRCDVAGMVPTDFWEEARAALEADRPDILMLAEASKPDLLVKAFDFDYAWPLHAKLNDVFLRGAPASTLRQSWEETKASFPRGSLHLRISDNHDEARAVARFGIRGAVAASVLMFTLDGVPLLYNGMEVGDATESGAPALFERLPVFWQPKERPPLRDFYRELIRLRRAHPAFTAGAVDWILNSNPADVVSFLRSDAKDEFLVVISVSSRPLTVAVGAPGGGAWGPVRLPGAEAPVAADLSRLSLGGYEWRIFRRGR